MERTSVQSGVRKSVINLVRTAEARDRPVHPSLTLCPSRRFHIMALFSRKPTGPFKVSILGMHWDTEDPFIFASHHEDDYPHGNRQQAPPLEQIGGRDLGRDYEKRLGFRMYHGKVVPGFPMHAHWGYETITLAELGYVDHFDNMGIEGRFGFGDVQWVCASSRYSHNEMYPLANQEDRNPNDITQIMLNLPLELKNRNNAVNTVWDQDVARARGDGWEAKVICGTFGDASAASPSPESWAHGDHGVRIIRFSLEPGARLTVDAGADGANRNLYFVSGKDATFNDIPVERESRLKILENTAVISAAIMMIVATDAPLEARNLERVAKRAFMGLAKSGGVASNGSGDFVIAFSTNETMRIPYDNKPLAKVPMNVVHNDDMTPIFMATIEATEEAIINSLFAAKDVKGFNGKEVKALPVDKVMEMMKAHNKLVTK